jgi:RNA polymerase sigma-70 factor, ECF subfamily
MDIEVEGLAADTRDAQRAAGGDAEAFERLYRRHSARIYALAQRMLQGDEEAADATQEVFVRTWQKLGLFRGDSAFGTWLHRVAINVILARRTTLATRSKRFGEGEGLEDVHLVASTKADTPELRLDFEVALKQLPGGAREVFVLHDVEGYKHEEIAGMLGVSVGTSKSQLHRARMTLRKHLER